MQSWASIPGRYQSRLAATLFDGLQEVPARRTPPHGRGVHQDQHLRRMLRFHSLLSRQELPAIAVGKRQWLPIGEIQLEETIVEIESQWTARRRENSGDYLKLIGQCNTTTPPRQKQPRMGHPSCQSFPWKAFFLLHAE